MLIVNSNHKRFLRYVLGGFFWFALLFGRIVCVGSEGEEGVHVYTSVQQENQDGAIGYVSLSEDLYGISGGNATAVLLTLEVSEGWHMDIIEVTPDTRGMQITVAFSEGNRRAEVLLDGYPQMGSGDGSILTVKLAGGKKDGRSCMMTVSPGRCGEGAVHYLGKPGEICTRPLYFEAPGMSDTEEMTFFCSDTAEQGETEGGSMHETPTGPSEETEMTCSSSVEEGEGETISEPSDKPREPFFRFLGCRETPVREGVFSVRFLFCAETAYTPVIGFSEGGRITTTVTVREGDYREIAEAEERGFCVPTEGEHLYTCTFWRLPSEGKNVFYVYTSDGFVRVIYENGQFSGYSRNKYAE